MKLQINGKDKELRDNISVKEMLLELDINLKTVVVELNEEIIKKDKWESTKLNENDLVEIVSFVGGG